MTLGKHQLGLKMNQMFLNKLNNNLFSSFSIQQQQQQQTNLISLGEIGLFSSFSTKDKNKQA